MVKVICAGFPKTGTKSLSRALRLLGYDNIHDYLEHLDYYMDDYLSLFAGKKTISEILDCYEEKGVECTVDMPPSFFFEEFYQRWPDAKVILTVRDEDAWFRSIKSMSNHIMTEYHWMTFCSRASARFEKYARSLYQCMLGDSFEKEWLWKMHYRRHNVYVQKVIPKDNLLVFNVSEGWKPLCNFLGKEIPTEDFPFENAARSQGNIIHKILHESQISKQATKEIIFFFSCIFVLVIAVAMYLFNIFS